MLNSDDDSRIQPIEQFSFSRLSQELGLQFHFPYLFLSKDCSSLPRPSDDTDLHGESWIDLEVLRDNNVEDYSSDDCEPSTSANTETNRKRLSFQLGAKLTLSASSQTLDEPGRPLSADGFLPQDIQTRKAGKTQKKQTPATSRWKPRPSSFSSPLTSSSTFFFKASSLSKYSMETLKYSLLIEEEMATGDVILFSSPTLVSKAVRTVTSSSFGHVGMLIKDPPASLLETCGYKVSSGALPHRIFVLESTIPTLDRRAKGGIHLIPLKWKLIEYTQSYGPNVLICWRKFIQETNLIRGIPSSRSEMLWSWIYQICEKSFTTHIPTCVKALYGANLENNFSNFFCSQLVASTFQFLELLPSGASELLANNYVPKDFSSEGRASFLGNFILLPEIRLRLYLPIELPLTFLKRKTLKFAATMFPWIYQNSLSDVELLPLKDITLVLKSSLLNESEVNQISFSMLSFSAQIHFCLKHLTLFDRKWIVDQIGIDAMVCDPSNVQQEAAQLMQAFYRFAGTKQDDCSLICSTLSKYFPVALDSQSLLTVAVKIGISTSMVFSTMQHILAVHMFLLLKPFQKADRFTSAPNMFQDDPLFHWAAYLHSECLWEALFESWVAWYDRIGIHNLSGRLVGIIGLFSFLWLFICTKGSHQKN